jgi:hypothetical protein
VAAPSAPEAIRLAAGTSADMQARHDLERCHLVAVEPASATAILAVATEDLLVVHAGEDAPGACGPFKIASVLADRLVLEPTPAAGTTAIHQAWLPLATGDEPAPQFLLSSPEETLLLPAVLAPATGAHGLRQVRGEEPPP